MKRPTSVKIGPLTYPVVWEGVLWRHETGLIGQHNPNDQCIRIAETLRTDHAACILAHEVMHALASLRGNDNPEETMCDVGAYDMAVFWQANPEAFSWYCQCLGLKP